MNLSVFIAIVNGKINFSQMEQQVRRTRLSHRDGEGHSGESREGRGSREEDLSLSSERIGKFDIYFIEIIFCLFFFFRNNRTARR